MAVLAAIKSPVVDDLQEFNKYFRKYVHSKAPLLNIITNYLLKRKGKQLRPTLVFLTARLFGDVSKSTYHAATLIELMHTATLIHDDVVDDAHQRRGILSINALWKNKVAVLVGDYLLSKGLLLAVDNKEFDLLRIVSEAVQEMSEGELIQIEKARKLDITEDIYFDIIWKKTATLIAACAESGARSAGADNSMIEDIKLFGKNIGIAFQIKDDLFDYKQSSVIGKPAGNDLKEKKMTLPLIYVLNKISPSEKKAIIKTIKNHNNNRKKIKEIISIVEKNGGMAYAEQKMYEYKQKADEILNKFPDNPARESLKEFVEFTAERKK